MKYLVPLVIFCITFSSCNEKTVNKISGESSILPNGKYSIQLESGLERDFLIVLKHDTLSHQNIKNLTFIYSFSENVAFNLNGKNISNCNLKDNLIYHSDDYIPKYMSWKDIRVFRYGAKVIPETKDVYLLTIYNIENGLNRKLTYPLILKLSKIK